MSAANRRYAGNTPSKLKYDAQNVVRVTVAFNRKTDPVATAKIESVEKRGEYIRRLVREDAERNKK